MEQQYLTNIENTLNHVMTGNNIGLQLSPLKPVINEWSLAGCTFRLYDWQRTTLPHRLNGSLLSCAVTRESLNI